MGPSQGVLSDARIHEIPRRHAVDAGASCAAAVVLLGARFAPIPSPTHFRVGRGRPDPLSYWAPSSDELRKTERAVYEHRGLRALELDHGRRPQQERLPAAMPSSRLRSGRGKHVVGFDQARALCRQRR